ncbi:DinB family protein [Brevibacillus choshinensis]|uniref:DinB family protein n=1 Tax=Brevibacillus choshinensis TaxID=54911 RepID=UPI002E216973|nr:DinB family protein [Brevibacillus choshinensis]MED4754925.1 DinB family protein [Brevibacillus choshinensis]MED4783605.1 DinB family protein [Brevibacillus choshinensis]
MTHDSLRLYKYNVWANERVFQRLQEVPREVCEQEIQSVFPTIMQTLKHILLTDHVWLLAMKGDTYENVGKTVGRLSQELEGKGLDGIHAGFIDVSKKFKDFFSQIDLNATAPYSHPTMGTIHAPYSDIIQHVVNHGTYHRGNISAMLRQLGHAGASHDYIYFLFEESQKQNS